MSFDLTSVLTIFMSLINGVFKSFSDHFVIVFIDDLVVYSKSKKEHKAHLHTMVRFLIEKKFLISIQSMNFCFLQCVF